MKVRELAEILGLTPPPSPSRRAFLDAAIKDLDRPSPLAAAIARRGDVGPLPEIDPSAYAPDARPLLTLLKGDG